MVGRERTALFGLACMCGYVALYVGTNVLTKLLAPSLPLVQIALFRYGLAIPVILLVFVASPNSTFRITSGGVHVTRGILAAVGSICGYAAIAELPLGDATALFFMAPLFVTAGAVFLLRERSGMVGGLCIAGGFLGVLAIAQPHFTSAAGILAGLGNALCAATGVLIVRRFRTTEGALSLGLTTSAVCVAILAYPALVTWTPVSMSEFLALAALGAMGGAATILLNVAYQTTPAPLLASVDYLAVPLSLAAGVVVWGDSTGLQAAAGCLIVVGAGLLNLGHRHLQPVWWLGGATRVMDVCMSVRKARVTTARP